MLMLKGELELVEVVQLPVVQLVLEILSFGSGCDDGVCDWGWKWCPLSC